MTENSKNPTVLAHVNIASLMATKASKKLADEIDEELLAEDPDEAGEIISKNKVTVND